MIQGFADAGTRRFFLRRAAARRGGGASRRSPLASLTCSVQLLRSRHFARPPGNRLEALKGDRAGRFSIRVQRSLAHMFRLDRKGPALNPIRGPSSPRRTPGRRKAPLDAGRDLRRRPLPNPERRVDVELSRHPAAGFNVLIADTSRGSLRRKRLRACIDPAFRTSSSPPNDLGFALSRRLGDRLPAPCRKSVGVGQRASSILIGVWSEALSLARIALSISTDLSRSAACGESKRWSMRMPLFFCQAPAW